MIHYKLTYKVFGQSLMPSEVRGKRATNPTPESFYLILSMPRTTFRFSTLVRAYANFIPSGYSVHVADNNIF